MFELLADVMSRSYMKGFKKEHSHVDLIVLPQMLLTPHSAQFYFIIQVAHRVACCRVEDLSPVGG